VPNKLLTVFFLSFALIAGTSRAPAQTQSPMSQTQKRVEAIRGDIAAALNVPGAEIEAARVGQWFIVDRADSAMKKGDAEAFKASADTIESVVAKAVAGDPIFKHTHIIRVDHIERKPGSAHKTILDRKDYWKTKQGEFALRTR
jgi:hypothetical protein